MTTVRAWMLPLLIALAILVYLFPWVQTPINGINGGAYDLAEWASLHPAVQSTLLPLIPSLLLRLHLPIFVLLLSLDIRLPAWSKFCVIALLIIAQFPPLEFLSERDNPNYQQQAALAILSIILMLISTIKGIRAKTRWILAGLGLFGGVLSLAGLAQIMGLLDDFQIAVQPAAGAFALTAIYVAVLVFALIEMKQTG